MVAQDGRVERGRNPMLSVHAEAWRFSLGQCRMRPLGSGNYDMCKITQLFFVQILAKISQILTKIDQNPTKLN